MKEVPLGDAVIKKPELDLAMQIIEQGHAERFKPETYEDEVRKRMLAEIEKKVQGEEITEEPQEEPKAQVIDLMEALKASLAKKEAGRKPAKRAAAKTAKSKAKVKRSKG